MSGIKLIDDNESNKFLIPLYTHLCAQRFSNFLNTLYAFEWCSIIIY